VALAALSADVTQGVGGHLPKIAALAMSLLCAPPAWAAAPHTGEKVTWDSVHCTGSPLQCNRMGGVGYLYAPPGATVAVTVSHGTQGLDRNVFNNYVDPLVEQGMAVLVIDHYGPRGLGRVSDNLIHGSAGGANFMNTAIDLLTAADWLRRQHGYKKIGSLGESSGGSAMLWVHKKWTVDWASSAVRGGLRKWFSAQPMDALVALYPFCGVRDEGRDRFFEAPVLIISGELDDATPAALCERYVPWMQERGANAKMITLRGHAHNFDFAHKLALGPRNHNPAKCDILVDRNGTAIDLPTGFSASNYDLGKVMAHCTTRGYHGGNNGNPRVAVPLWTVFFKQNL